MKFQNLFSMSCSMLRHNFLLNRKDISVVNKLFKIHILIILMVLSGTEAFSQTTVTFATPGTTTWTAPCGVTSVTVRVWGGGGGGGVGGSTNGQAAGGGGGGGYSTSTVAVIPGTSYSLTVGAGGAGGTTVTGATANGSTGGTSTMLGVAANGGSGGFGYNNGFAGGTGGTGTTFNGGNGAAAINGTNPCGNNTGRGGGGGEGACTTQNGNNAINNTGGTGCDGGDGGNAGCSNQSGANPGLGPGGGGGGAVKNFPGAAGAAGQISVIFTCPSTLANAGTDQILTPCTTSASVTGNSLSCAVSDAWSIVSNTGTLPTLSNATGPTTNVSGITIGAIVTLRWTIDTGVAPAGCGTYSDDVVITSPCPANTLNAGSDINISDCTITSATLSANTLACGSGSWSVVSGSATITDPTLSSSGVTGLVPGTSATLRWTWSFAGGLCGPYMDDIVITVPPPPTPLGAPVIINSQCQAPCTLGGGSIQIGSLSCTNGSLEYSTDGGVSWSSIVPTYNQSTPITFSARCNCSNTGSTPTSNFSTTPGSCASSNCPPTCNASNGTITPTCP